MEVIEKENSGWQILRVGAAGRPSAFYRCPSCGTESYFELGSGRVPDPRCCNGYRAYPDDSKFREFLTAKPRTPESEAAYLKAVQSKAVTDVSGTLRSRPMAPIIAVIARSKGKKRK